MADVLCVLIPAIIYGTSRKPRLLLRAHASMRAMSDRSLSLPEKINSGTCVYVCVLRGDLAITIKSSI